MIHLGKSWIEKFLGFEKWVFLSWRLEWQTFGWIRNEMATLLRFDECAQSQVAVSSAGNASRAAQNNSQTFSFKVDFGEVFIPPGLDVPRPRVLPEFKRLAHGLRSSNISVLDAKTFYIPNLHYDGAGPDAYFWVGNGSAPNIMGVKVPNELGSYEVLRGIRAKTLRFNCPETWPSTTSTGLPSGVSNIGTTSVTFSFPKIWMSRRRLGRQRLRWVWYCFVMGSVRWCGGVNFNNSWKFEYYEVF